MKQNDLGSTHKSVLFKGQSLEPNHDPHKPSSKHRTHISGHRAQEQHRASILGSNIWSIQHVRVMSSSSRPFPTFEPEVAPISVEPKYRAYILLFVYLGVDAIDATEEQKVEKLDVYAIAAHELLLVNHGVGIGPLNIRKYYTQVRFQAKRVDPRKWDTSGIGTIIAQQIKEKEVFDAIINFNLVSIRAFESLPPIAKSSIKKRNVSEDTQKLVAEVTETADRVAATNLVRDSWTRMIDDGERPIFQLVEPDLQRYPRAMPLFGASIASYFNEKADQIPTDNSKHTP